MTDRAQRVALAVIVLAALLAALYGAFLLPILEGADENCHLDYAWCLASAGRLLSLGSPPLVALAPGQAIPVVHPDLWLLTVRTDLLAVRWNPERRMPPGYGSPDYFAKLNAESSGLGAAFQRNPFVMAQYPFGWYALVALWLGLVNRFDHQLVSLFFAARMTSVALLGVSLVAVRGILRELRVPNLRSLLMTAAYGFFPLTFGVSSYAHPENLSAALTLLVIWAALVARRGIRADDPQLPWVLTGLGLGALLITKYHFFACTLLATAPMLLLEVPSLSASRRRWQSRLAWLFVPSLICGAVQVWVGGGIARHTAFVPGAERGELRRSLGAVGYAALGLKNALRDIYGGGLCFRTFWGEFGWVDTPIQVGPPAVDRVFWQALQAVCLILLVLAFCWAARLGVRIARLVRGGRRGTALSLVLSNPLMTSFLLYSVLYVVLYVSTLNGFSAQGRNWLPYLLSIFWLGVFYAPRAIPSRHLAEALSKTLVVLSFLYSLALFPLGVDAIRHRYYGDADGFLPVSPAEPSRVAMGAWAVVQGGPDGRPALESDEESQRQRAADLERKRMPDSAFRVEWTAPSLPATLSAGQSLTVSVGVKNISDTTWPDPKIADPDRPTRGAYAVRLSYRFRTPAEASTLKGFDSRVELPGPLAPGESVTMEVPLKAPAAPGDYTLQFDLVQEMYAWFSLKGAAQLVIPVKVK